MNKITSEMREKLREPLPREAVSQHPTKTYMSSIKSIYVTERINDVFGLGSWTLKSTPIDMGEKMIVVQAVLEIPEYGFYGESYGCNDNVDRGDAYKGATTDALTKIAAQQLEIGIDVFKGLETTKPSPAKPASSKAEHWCKEHDTQFFIRGKMKSYAHPIGDTGEWCPEQADEPRKPEQVEKPTESNIDMDWLAESLKVLEDNKIPGWAEATTLSYFKITYKVEAETVLEAAGKLDAGQATHFVKSVETALKMV